MTILSVRAAVEMSLLSKVPALKVKVRFRGNFGLGVTGSHAAIIVLRLRGVM